MLVVAAGRRAGAARLLRRGARAAASILPRARRSIAVEVSFGDAVQVFNVGAASCGVPGTPAGLWEAAQRFGTLAAGRPGGARRAARPRRRRDHARAGLRLRDPRADHASPPTQARERFMPEGRILGAGDVLARPGAGRHARAARPPRGRRRSTRATSPRRSSPGRRARRRAHARGPGRLRARRSREPVRVRLPRPRGADEPAAERRRDPARVRARACSTAGPPPPDAGALIEAMRARARRAHAGVPRRPRRARVRRALRRAGSARPRTSRRSTPTAGPAR